VAAFFFGAGRSGTASTIPRFFDCVRPDFLDEGGGQRMCRRLWRRILSMGSIITITQPYCVTNHELHALSSNAHAKLIHHIPCSPFHILDSRMTGLWGAHTQILRYFNNPISSSSNIPITHQFMHHRFFAESIYHRLIVKSDRQKNARKPERPGVTGDG
jgi:hypothetical protein